MDRHPDVALLIVEVADTSLDYDRETKGPLYAASRVPEYWIVDIAGKAVEVYTEPSGEQYGKVERFGPGACVRPRALPDIELYVADLFP